MDRSLGVYSARFADTEMPLIAGARLGPYEIVSALGAGGMSACGYAEAAAKESRSEASALVRGGGGAPPPVQEMLAPSPCR